MQLQDARSRINFMYLTKLRNILLLISTAFCFSCLLLAAQADSVKKKVNPVEEAKTFREAMDWFKKAEAMIGTPSENSEEQAELFRKAIQAKPDFVEAHYNLGLVYANQKKMKEAAGEFETVLRIEPKFDQGIHYLLATTYQEDGNYPAAIAALEKGLLIDPKDPKLVRSLAYLQYNSKNDAAAVQTLQRLLEIDPTDVSAHIDLALLFQKNNEFEKAVEHFQEALNKDPGNYAAHYNLAIIYMRQKKSSEAASEFESANKIRPGNAELLEKLGDVYSYQQQHEKAAAAYRAALDKVTDRGAVFAKLGFSLANLNQPGEAVTALESAVQLNARNADVLFLLGDLYSDLKRFDDAMTAYKKSLEINPKQKEVHYNLGTLYAEQNRFGDAIAELKIAVQLDPKYSQAWANMALVAEKLELDREAIEAHEKVVSLGKGQALNFFHLGVLYAKIGQAELAIAALARAIEIEPDRYRAILREELKKVHSVLDSVRYQESFIKLLGPAPSP